MAPEGLFTSCPAHPRESVAPTRESFHSFSPSPGKHVYPQRGIPAPFPPKKSRSYSLPVEVGWPVCGHSPT